MLNALGKAPNLEPAERSNFTDTSSQKKLEVNYELQEKQAESK